MRFVPVATFFALLLLGPIAWVGMQRCGNAQSPEIAGDKIDPPEKIRVSRDSGDTPSTELTDQKEGTETANPTETTEPTESAEATSAARQRAAIAAKRRAEKTGKRTGSKENKTKKPSTETVEAPLARKNEASKDSQPGFLTLSDGSTIAGTLFLTRDKRIKIEDKTAERQREIPLSAIVSIEAIVEREWMEDEWRFRENANNEKYYTGRSYPTRIYHHRVTLRDGRKIDGALSEVVYVDPAPELVYPEMSPSEVAASGLTIATRRFLLHKRDKGEPGETLGELLYVKQIRLGEDTLEEGLAKARKSPIPEGSTRKDSSHSPSATKTLGEKNATVAGSSQERSATAPATQKRSSQETTDKAKKEPLVAK